MMQSVTSNTKQLRSVQLLIEGMDCTACSSRIEKLLNRMPGVKAAVNFATEKAHILIDPDKVSPSDLIATIEKAGYGASEAQKIDNEKRAVIEKKQQKLDLYRFLVAFICSLPFLWQMIVMLWPTHHGNMTAMEMPRFSQWVLATIVEFGAGAPFFVAAWKSLRSGAANMDVLITLGTGIAYLYSTIVTFLGLSALHVYFEASAMIITLILLGRLLESHAKSRAGSAMRSLLSLQPKKGHIEEEGKIVDVDIDQIKTGNIVLIRAGERVPVDGIIISGESDVDEAMLTGEAMPVSKKAGDKIFAATINKGSPLRIEAIAVGNDTALGGIIRMVEEAQGSKAPIQKLADKIASIFVPIVMGIAVLTFILSWWITGIFSYALVSAVATLVIACPCSLGLAVPTAIMVGTGAGAKSGILIRNAESLERAQNINCLIVDKTGTVTEGKPAVSTVLLASSIDQTYLLNVALSLSLHSSHPLSQAITHFCHGQSAEAFQVSQITEKAGLGLTAIKPDHSIFKMGSLRFLHESGVDVENDMQQSSFNKAHIENVEREGATFVHFAEGSHYLGSLALTDPIRSSSKEAVKAFHHLGIKVIMMTGDNANTAAAIAEKSDIKTFKANLLPQGKADEIQTLRKQGYYVAMVGDGINDAPALAIADVSFAIGAGSDIAMEAADIVLVKSDLRDVVSAITLSRATMRKMRQNLFFAFIYNILGIPLAAFGFLNPVIAGAAMAMSSVSVISNSLLLSRWKPF
ncbi:MAG: heavy metal translocating P-type ATPase [Zymomonas mobilis subsp. pomaceae]|uniref:P-type Cu(2+) transporter n=1 Tax=Zymomonas mobilis subsp. pomaceae (strain ATCC 29192 / DSM 22645 / JCM 10191 / CCUG 17912 / NBRC 13757 / NCIMB 11200 / NRRL B-4491 / Barker I) TaxID=579138 RepID=F8EUW8_ZYMMT|nr:heavy metal translocating P-type ATPase [Zymomonas mobilis]AEI37256.1 copper-translocating P-type ATPase [Zymomonas mobilis subsp. pomaceae ATCC 29192]MDX5948625.1 heavy metal translocating P-type ATPase [Zymomonas mobilis subsp. pomaceae]GEB88431.1 copper-exporting P-type ATPase A [Zymomonas mobilis subsp. pomaceae]